MTINTTTSRRLASTSLTIVVLAIAMFGFASAAQAQTFELVWTSLDCGGGEADGGAFALDCTIGQSDAGPALTGGTFSLVGGFWPGAAPVCAADVNGNGAVNVDDLLAVINGWGSCPVPPAGCPADIAPPGGNDVVNVDDLLAVINGWGGCP